jgi:hypothetical protein
MPKAEAKAEFRIIGGNHLYRFSFILASGF